MNKGKHRIFIAFFAASLIGIGCGHFFTQGAFSPKSLTRASLASEWEECNPNAMGANIQKGDRLPTKIIYHYGAPNLLAKDTAHHQVPEEDWNQFIMGSVTRFKLKPYRRGLYGTEMPEDADQFSSDQYKGLIAIEIKDECLTASRVSTLINLPKSNRFKNWYQGSKEKKTFEAWSETCFNSEGLPRSGGEDFQFYESPSETESECEDVVRRYWQDTGVGIVQDQMITRSWFIRDRNCIADIEGTAEYWATTLSQKADLWKNSCDHYTTHRARVRVFLNALAESLKSIPVTFSFEKFLSDVAPPDVHEDEDFAANDFAHEFDQALGRCRVVGKEQEFKDTIKDIADNVDGLETSDVKKQLGSICL